MLETWTSLRQYSDLTFFGGLQFSDSNLFNNCCCLYLYKLWVIFYQMIIMMFIIPIFGFVKTLDYIDKYSYDIAFDCFDIFAYPIWFWFSIANLCFYACLGTALFVISIFFWGVKEKLLTKLFERY